jgi:hypothetical protein
MLAALARQLRRPRVLFVALPLLLLVLVLIKLWPARQMPEVHSTKNEESRAPVPPPTPKQDLANNNSSPPPSAQNPHLNKPRQKPTPRSPAVAREFVAQEQRVDLADVSEFRQPQMETLNSGSAIVASPSAPTRLRITLPAHSSRGPYEVSIRDQAFLKELVPAIGNSLDGVNLLTSMDLRRLKTDNYVLRITRRDPRTGHDEYVGDYNVRIVLAKADAAP